MSLDATVFSSLLHTTTPALPDAGLMRLYLSLGWAVVLVALGVVLSSRLSCKVRSMLALGLAVWSMLPGPLSPAYWLGLAFQAPSVTSVLLCGWLLQRAWLVGVDHVAKPDGVTRGQWLLVLCAVVLGYALLLDTLALLPWQLYAWGFSAALLLALTVWALLPWLLSGKHIGASMPVWIAPAALLLFAATRLPSGNVWDALMDPLLWLFLQGVLVRMLYRRVRPAKPL